jgi:hypothetical protein
LAAAANPNRFMMISRTLANCCFLRFDFSVGNTPLKAGSYRSNNCDPEFLHLAARTGKETHPTIAGIVPSTPCLHKRPCVQMCGAETNDEDTQHKR